MLVKTVSVRDSQGGTQTIRSGQKVEQVRPQGHKEEPGEQKAAKSAGAGIRPKQYRRK